MRSDELGESLHARDGVAASRSRASSSAADAYPSGMRLGLRATPLAQALTSGSEVAAAAERPPRMVIAIHCRIESP